MRPGIPLPYNKTRSNLINKTFSIQNLSMSKRKFVRDIPPGLNELLQKDIPMNDMKLYIKQKLEKVSFFD